MHLTFTRYCHDLLAAWREAPGLLLVQGYILGLILLARRQAAQSRSDRAISPDSEA